MTTTELVYLRGRERIERQFADDFSSDIAVRAAHLEMARNYAKQIAVIVEANAGLDIFPS